MNDDNKKENKNGKLKSNNGYNMLKIIDYGDAASACKPHVVYINVNEIASVEWHAPIAFGAGTQPKIEKISIIVMSNGRKYYVKYDVHALVRFLQKQQAVNRYLTLKDDYNEEDEYRIEHTHYGESLGE